MSSAGAALRATVSVGDARAEASRRKGARSRGPAPSKARAARDALTHGTRAPKHVVLPDEHAEFAGPSRACRLAIVGGRTDPRPDLKGAPAEPPPPVRALPEPAAPGCRRNP